MEAEFSMEIDNIDPILALGVMPPTPPVLTIKLNGHELKEDSQEYKECLRWFYGEVARAVRRTKRWP